MNAQEQIAALRKALELVYTCRYGERGAPPPRLHHLKQAENHIKSAIKELKDHA